MVCNLDDETLQVEWPACSYIIAQNGYYTAQTPTPRATFNLQVANSVSKRFGEHFPAQKSSGLVILERCGIVEPSLTGVD